MEISLSIISCYYYLLEAIASAEIVLSDTGDQGYASYFDRDGDGVGCE
ncbi:excalibur calcium-binding domain-containing protein [Lentibacillus persicus]|nr:excalibur calcium-binding domain-containing protein [Lentibacillus persicus]